MNIEEIRKALRKEQELEYHVTGGEIDPGALVPGPGWYPCFINWICDNGDVEISLAGDLDGVSVTVLAKNIPIAFRVKPDKSHPTIVCLCGSTRFSQAFHVANLKETLAGKIVLSIGIDTKSDRDLLLAGQITREDKRRLDELHLRKIDLADEILVLNVNGYIGSSTANEIAYAASHGKRIRYLEEDWAPRMHTQEQSLFIGKDAN